MFNNHTYDDCEINKFSQVSEQWWNEAGVFKHLHLMNKLRLSYIIGEIYKNYGRDITTRLNGLKILDIGCGGGLLSVPICNLGADVTAIDASAANLDIAKRHALEKNLSIDFQHIAIEELVNTKKDYFDIVCMLEVVEHVADLELFLASACDVLKNNGLMFISTINRTIKSKIQAIYCAEYILQMVPHHTHNWSKFLPPSEIAEHIIKYRCHPIDIKGMKFNIFNQSWFFHPKIDVNYIMAIKKIEPTNDV